MTGPFDSLGVGVAVAGIVIGLAGVFLTPMRGYLFGTVRARAGRGQEPETEAPPPPGPKATGTPAPQTGTEAPVEPPAPSGEPREADYHGQEALFGRTLLTAQKTADDLIGNAQAEAQDILARAEATAAETLRASRKNASEILQKAQQDADVIVESAKQKAAAWLGLLQAEADHLAADAHQAFEDAQRTVEHKIATLTARFERRMAEWDADPWRQPQMVAAGNGDAEDAAEETTVRIA
jgi:cell division septum initiation protein DivIVA